MENDNGNQIGNNVSDNIYINNNNNYAEEYRMDNDDNNNDHGHDREHEHEPMNSQVLPIAMHSNVLRMLYELRVPLYALGDLEGGGGAAGAHDDMEQEAMAVLANSLYDARPVKRVIDVADGESGEKHGIREMTYDPETAEELKINTTCGIWQEEFEKGQAIKVLPCNHAFLAEAITKWLTTEKAECPICRFKMESKEVIVHPPAGEDDNDNDSDTTDTDDEAEESWQRMRLSQRQPQPQPLVNEPRAMENNIMYRQNNNIYNRPHGGGGEAMGREYYHGVSMPMNRLVQMRGRLVQGARAGAAQAHAHATPIHEPLQSSQNRQPPSVMNINHINHYYLAPANNNINQDYYMAQEQADIEEAIRRSLE